MRPYALMALAGCFALSCSKDKPPETAYDQRYPRSGAYQQEEQQMQPASGTVYEKETVIEEYDSEQAPSDPLAEPVEQGTSVDDQRTTEKIRLALDQDTSLSSEAKNVKVITLNKRVTLRGPVTSMEEAQRVEAHAKAVAGPDNVKNELEIRR